MKRKLALILSCIMLIGLVPVVYAREEVYTAVPTPQSVFVDGK